MADKVILTPTKKYRQQANNKIYVTVTSDCVSSVKVSFTACQETVEVPERSVSALLW